MPDKNWYSVHTGLPGYMPASTSVVDTLGTAEAIAIDEAQSFRDADYFVEGSARNRRYDIYQENPNVNFSVATWQYIEITGPHHYSYYDAESDEHLAERIDDGMFE